MHDTLYDPVNYILSENAIGRTSEQDIQLASGLVRIAIPLAHKNQPTTDLGSNPVPTAASATLRTFEPFESLMPELQPSLDPQVYSLSKVATNVVYHITELLCRLRDLEKEEAELNAKARQLMDQLPETKEPSTPSRSNLTTSALKPRSQRLVERGATSPTRVDLRNIETPVKTFLLTESFALAMSIKSKRKGRVFLAGGSTEFGEKMQS